MKNNDSYTITLSKSKTNRVASFYIPTPLTDDEKLRLIAFIELVIEPREDESTTVMHHPV